MYRVPSPLDEKKPLPMQVTEILQYENKFLYASRRTGEHSLDRRKDQNNTGFLNTKNLYGA